MYKYAVTFQIVNRDYKELWQKVFKTAFEV